MIGGTRLALCPPVTASDRRAAIIVPRWHESPTGNPSNKTAVRLECWQSAGTRGSTGPELEGHVTR
ncbi:hypothetical protein GBF38_019279 [Nibea albiflora]|uniref:Uncharacterized protein n=1 Tax=Nibea albiflora TaxID=240163 RepID=A0ACB7F584_NIBAL|nr:hypothetical protein GBF38_019279 [Nibea albiflora]